MSLLGAEVNVGPLGYEILRELAASNLGMGAQVLVDLVTPLPITRGSWTDLAAYQDVQLTVFECQVADAVEHRRGVETRATDLAGQVVPIWAEVLEGE